MLESEWLIFRKLTESDFDELAEMLRDPVVIAAWEDTFSYDEIRKVIEKQRLRYKEHIVAYFAAIRKDGGVFLEQMDLIWNDIGEIGPWKSDIC